MVIWIPWASNLIHKLYHAFWYPLLNPYLSHYFRSRKFDNLREKMGKPRRFLPDRPRSTFLDPTTIFCFPWRPLVPCNDRRLWSSIVSRVASGFSSLSLLELVPCSPNELILPSIGANPVLCCCPIHTPVYDHHSQLWDGINALLYFAKINMLIIVLSSKDSRH